MCSRSIVIDDSCVVEIIASQLLVVRSRKVASVRLTYEMHVFYIQQLLIVNNSQLEVAIVQAP